MTHVAFVLRSLINNRFGVCVIVLCLLYWSHYSLRRGGGGGGGGGGVVV